jgi:hypothetical protein
MTLNPRQIPLKEGITAGPCETECFADDIEIYGPNCTVRADVWGHEWKLHR